MSQGAQGGTGCSPPGRAGCGGTPYTLGLEPLQKALPLPTQKHHLPWEEGHPPTLLSFVLKCVPRAQSFSVGWACLTKAPRHLCRPTAAGAEYNAEHSNVEPSAVKSPLCLGSERRRKIHAQGLRSVFLAQALEALNGAPGLDRCGALSANEVFKPCP